MMRSQEENPVQNENMPVKEQKEKQAIQGLLCDYHVAVAHQGQVLSTAVHSPEA